MLSALGRAATRITDTSPLTGAYGLARTLLATATLATLLGNDTATLFPRPPACDGLGTLSAYCLSPAPEPARWVSVVLLAAVASGLYPRWTAVPHWYAAWSLHVSATTVDGGDQVAAVVALLLVPVALADRRTTHWSPPLDDPDESDRTRWLVALAGLTAVRVQAAVVYFHAGVAKFGVPEWADGTALYYWLTDPVFGAPDWSAGLFGPLLRNGVAVSLLTWAVPVGEVVLALGLVAPLRVRRLLFAAAVAFHLATALVLGLASFALAMIALDVLFLCSPRRPVAVTRPHPAGRSPAAVYRQEHPRDPAGHIRRVGQRDGLPAGGP